MNAIGKKKRVKYCGDSELDSVLSDLFFFLLHRMIKPSHTPEKCPNIQDCGGVCCVRVCVDQLFKSLSVLH